MYRARLSAESTPQEVYDHLKAAFAAGSFPSFSEGVTTANKCLYKNGDKACHFGIFIPPELYSSDFEHESLAEVIEDLERACPNEKMFPDWFVRYESDGILFCRDLQHVHDRLVMGSLQRQQKNGKAAEEYFREYWLDNVKALFASYGYQVVDKEANPTETQEVLGAPLQS